MLVCGRDLIDWSLIFMNFHRRRFRRFVILASVIGKLMGCIQAQAYVNRPLDEVERVGEGERKDVCAERTHVDSDEDDEDDEDGPSNSSETRSRRR